MTRARWGSPRSSLAATCWSAAPLGTGQPAGRRNLDRVYVVTSATDPHPIPQLIDRLCAIAEANEIPVALVINKSELGSGDALAARYRHAGYEVFLVSAKTGAGLDPLFQALRGRESLLTGASGVGKSTILNRLSPGLALRTGEVSEKNRRGKNTTVAAVLVPLPGGGWLVDTPGFSDVGLWGIEPRELASCFPEMRGLIDRCKFADCTHRDEPACAIREPPSVRRHRSAPLRQLSDPPGRVRSAPKDWE